MGTARLYPTEEQAALLEEYTREYTAVLNHVSDIAYRTQCSRFRTIHDDHYYELRRLYRLGAQAVISAEKETVAKYKAVHAHKSKADKWKNPVRFRKHTSTLVYSRDYSLKCRDGQWEASVPSLHGRVKIEVKGVEDLNDPDIRLGTATMQFRHGKWLLRIPATREVDSVPLTEVDNVVGVDMGLRFLATSYDSKGNTTFHRGGEVKNTRAKYKLLRRDLQRKGTPSSRRKLRKIGSRESRWMSNVNHIVAKALVAQAGTSGLIVVEDLTGIRTVTESVRRKDRYTQVSWAFYDLRQKIEYKAALNGSIVIAVDPRYTSQMCPKCGHTEKGNRTQSKHVFCCKRCGYTSNDDRVAAMNLHAKGIQYRVQTTLSTSEGDGLLSTSPDAPPIQGGKALVACYTSGQEQTPSVRAG